MDRPYCSIAELLLHLSTSGIDKDCSNFQTRLLVADLFGAKGTVHQRIPWPCFFWALESHQIPKVKSFGPSDRRGEYDPNFQAYTLDEAYLDAGLHWNV